MPSLTVLLRLLPYALSAAISAGVAAYCWRRRARPGVAAFAVVAASEAAWTLGYLFELASPGVRGKLFWDNAQFVPFAVIPVGFLAFAHGFTGRLPRHPLRVYAALVLPLLALAVLAFTDPLHGLVRDPARGVAAPAPLAPLEYGFTWVESAAAVYIYGMEAVAFAVLAAAWMRTHPLYRTQVNVIGAGLLIPTLGSVLTLTVLAESSFRDLTPYTFAAANLIVVWGLFRRGLFDVVPVARHAVVESLSDAVYVLDAAGRVVDLNAAGRAAARGDAATALGRPAREVLPLPAGLAERLHENGATEVDVDGGGPAGGAVQLGVHPLHGPQGEHRGSVVVLHDIAERKRAEEELRRSRDRLESVVDERTAELVAANARLRSEIAARQEAGEALRASEESLRQIAENSSELFWLLEGDRRVAYLSPAFERMWGMPREEIRADADLALRNVVPEDRAAVRAMVDEGYLRPASATYRVVRPDGTLRWLQTRAAPVHDERGAVYRVAGVTEDVTERKRMEDQLLHDAFHDALTGLPNRALFLDRLQHSLELFRRHPDRGFAVMILDLDRFKLVNDSLGHLSGDRLLASVADRLRAAMRDGDTVARFGGDEFALLLEDVPDAGEALREAERIRAGLDGPFALEGHELFVTPSIGIALSGPGTAGPEEMVRRADTAMYRAKELGGARCEVFDRAMHARALSRLRLETELRRALERGELEAAYQPIVSLPGGRVAGFEALVRWRHPERGLLAPGAFLEVAEETGLIVAIDRWVLREACTRLADWRARHPGLELRMTVNLSGNQFAHSGLVHFLEQTVAETGVDVDWLRLEITERALVGRAEETLLAELRARGVQMLIDDFGTGYSSLGYLHRLPISALKVDRSFLAGPEPNFAIVGAVVALAHNLGKEVVVEGVERADQLARLVEMRADYAQGYLFSPPVDAVAAEPLIQRCFVGEGWTPANP